jgi:uncharacterized Ntn-hydrolase superfamily protein
MRTLVLLSALLLFPLVNSLAAGDVLESPARVNTYSIVAYDSATGEFGAAVQSHYYKVADVIWLEAGVGAVATQSLVDFAYGPLGLDMMRNGKSARQALDGLLASDSLNRIRQVAMIDRNGVVATHTGSKCIAYAGHHVGRFYSCEANLMRDSTVWGAMSKAFETAKGDLADRLMAALEAAQGEGGDIRGMQSAAMVVVSGKPTGQIWKDRKIDIRVDDSPQPLVELKRLLNLTRAYDHMNNGDDAIAVKNWDKAGEEYGAAAKLAPGNLEVTYWYAVALVTAGQVDRALPLFKDIFKADPNWRTLIPRLVDADQLPNQPDVIKKIMSQ